MAILLKIRHLLAIPLWPCIADEIAIDGCGCIGHHRQVHMLPVPPDYHKKFMHMVIRPDIGYLFRSACIPLISDQWFHSSVLLLWLWEIRGEKTPCGDMYRHVLAKSEGNSS